MNEAKTFCGYTLGFAQLALRKRDATCKVCRRYFKQRLTGDLKLAEINLKTAKYVYRDAYYRLKAFNESEG